MTSLKRICTMVAALAIATTVGCAATATSESTGQYVDDTAITAKVKKDIFDEPTLKSAEINVETYKGVVQLSGFVSSSANVSTAVAVAKNLNGVKSVKNDTRVKSRPGAAISPSGSGTAAPTPCAPPRSTRTTSSRASGGRAP